jgi:hypothetical protein
MKGKRNINEWNEEQRHIIVTVAFLTHVENFHGIWKLFR